MITSALTRTFVRLFVTIIGCCKLISRYPCGFLTSWRCCWGSICVKWRNVKMLARCRLWFIGGSARWWWWICACFRGSWRFRWRTTLKISSRPISWSTAPLWFLRCHWNWLSANWCSPQHAPWTKCSFCLTTCCLTNVSYY